MQKHDDRTMPAFYIMDGSLSCLEEVTRETVGHIHRSALRMVIRAGKYCLAGIWEVCVLFQFQPPERACRSVMLRAATLEPL